MKRDVLLEALVDTGGPDRIRFDDPAHVMLIEALAGWCGVTLWETQGPEAI
jgi:hypothetical protein